MKCVPRGGHGLARTALPRSQANYAAANCALDALATRRGRGGSLSTSVQWGAWAEVGMASRLDERARRSLRSSGLGLVEVGRGLAALAASVRPAAPRVLGVLQARWATVVATLGQACVPAVLADLAPPPPPEPTSPKGDGSKGHGQWGGAQGRDANATVSRVAG